MVLHIYGLDWLIASGTVNALGFGKEEDIADPRPAISEEVGT